MRNLLSAGFLRLFRSKCLYVTLAVMAVIGAVEPIVGYAKMAELAAAGAEDAAVSLDSRFFIFPLLAGILLSAFSALFVGAEYSGGTIRNKLVAGHSRPAVYLSNLILCAIAGVLLCLGYIAAVLAVGLPLLGPLRPPLPLTLWYIFCALVMTAALAALFTMISMLCQSRAVTAVTCISLAYFLLFLGIFLNARLTEPELYPERQYVEEGRIVTEAARPNLAYVRGTKRAVYQFLYDLPGCHVVQLAATLDRGAPPRLPLCSLAVIILSSGAGMALFQRKDLK